MFFGGQFLKPKSHEEHLLLLSLTHPHTYIKTSGKMGDLRRNFDLIFEAEQKVVEVLIFPITTETTSS